MSTSILEQVRTVAADLFGVPAAKLTPDSSPQTVETWDSIQHLNLVLELEQAFGIQFAAEEIEGFQTINDFAKAVEAKAVK